MITLWGRKSSSNVQAAMWCAAELGLDVKRIDAGIHYGVTKTPEYLAMNPNATVPTIKDGDHPPLWETGAILRYLAGMYGNEIFWPSAPDARMSIDQWCEWSKINVALNFTGPVFWRVFRTPVARQDPEAIRAALEVLERYLHIADQQLSENEYLACDDFTLADIQLGHVLYRYFDIDIDRPELPHVERYYSGLTERSAYQDHVMVSYEELRDTK